MSTGEEHLVAISILIIGKTAVTLIPFLKRFVFVFANLTLWNRELKWEPRGAWKTVENHGPFAHQNDARSIEHASFADETCPTFSIAENTGRGSSAAALLQALKDFFKDNPTWE